MAGALRAALAACLASAPALALPAGDPARGEAVYARCFACHSLDADRTGPRHCGLLGRRAGSVPGFDYSPAMRASGIVWDAKSLDRFLADPVGTVPGTSMGYAGIKEARERADLIAYLGKARCGNAKR
ncbi:MAG: c-type cytochrome [Betaproteobacteria bacterium]|nr:c-type cytochrome [Betaproteobacteria bacterium]PWB61001.1 MAG: cytochrome c family protein [Betaproteobacteria bacterium]